MEKIANLRTEITAIANAKGGQKNPLFMTAWRDALAGQSLARIESIPTLESIKEELSKAPDMAAFEASQKKAAEQVQPAQQIQRQQPNPQASTPSESSQQIGTIDPVMVDPDTEEIFAKKEN